MHPLVRVCAQRIGLPFLSLSLSCSRLRFPSCAAVPATTRRNRGTREQVYGGYLLLQEGEKEAGQESTYYLAATASLAFSASWSLSLLPRSVRGQGKEQGGVNTENSLVGGLPRLESDIGSSRTIVCARRKMETL